MQYNLFESFECADCREIGSMYCVPSGIEKIELAQYSAKKTAHFMSYDGQSANIESPFLLEKSSDDTLLST